MINYRIILASENIEFWHISFIFTVHESISMMYSIIFLISTCRFKIVRIKVLNKNGKLAAQIQSLILRQIKSLIYCIWLFNQFFRSAEVQKAIFMENRFKSYSGNLDHFISNTMTRSVSEVLWQNGYSGTNPNCISQYYRRLRRLRRINIIAVGVECDTFWVNWVPLWNWIQPDTRISNHLETVSNSTVR